MELATLEWVWWFNNQRMHSGLDDRTPAKVKASYYHEQNPVSATATDGKQ
jgi:transposase InsO family protein